MTAIMRNLAPGIAAADVEDPVVLGSVGQAYGVKGWVKVHSYTDPLANILNYQPWFLAFSNGYQRITIDHGKPHGKGLVAHIEGCDDRTTAQHYAGLKIAVAREQLPPLAEGEYYLADLEGMVVRNEQGIDLGVAQGLMETGANDVLIVKGDKQRMIPFVEEHYIKHVDVQQRLITVDWDPEF